MVVHVLTTAVVLVAAGVFVAVEAPHHWQPPTRHRAPATELAAAEATSALASDMIANAAADPAPTAW